MTAALGDELRSRVDRPDGQEDICLATYRRSSGLTRTSALVTSVVEPRSGDRHVHGNASIEGAYVIRAAAVARERGDGLILCHSHPGGSGWQPLSGLDFDAESSFANLARELTGLPMVGMTYAGTDRSWSARHWDHGTGTNVCPTHAENVRVVGAELAISWNPEIVPTPGTRATQHRTISCWGPDIHANLARRSVLVVGTGSVGLDVATRLAATGLRRLGVMDFDVVEPRNLDRLVGATPADAALKRTKLHVVRRAMQSAGTAIDTAFEFFEHSICEPEGLAVALDYDLIISCVDRPWPRAVLNQIAYTDLVPVIDGGISIDVFSGGDGMRNATWRSHVIRPGRPCLVCNGQLDLSEVSLDRQGLLDDPSYIAGADRHEDGGQNVALLAISATASILAQFVSFNVAPGGLGDPGPLQYHLSTHSLEHLVRSSQPNCLFEAAEAIGDRRQALTGRHVAAERLRSSRIDVYNDRITRSLDGLATWLRERVDLRIRRVLEEDGWTRKKRR